MWHGSASKGCPTAAIPQSCYTRVTPSRDYRHRTNTKTSMGIIIKYPRETIFTHLKKYSVILLSMKYIFKGINYGNAQCHLQQLTFSGHNQSPYPVGKTNCREHKKKLKIFNRECSIIQSPQDTTASTGREKIMLCDTFYLIREWHHIAVLFAVHQNLSMKGKIR